MGALQALQQLAAEYRGKMMNDERHRIVGRFSVRESHFQEVRENMQVELLIDVTDDIVEAFLSRHPTLLGMIVGYNEVETEAERAIGEGCRADFPPEQQRFTKCNGY